MASLYLLIIIKYIPLYFNSCLGYISFYSLCLSLLTLKPLNPILNITFILLSFYFLFLLKALNSRQVLCLFTALNTSINYNLLIYNLFVYKDSRSLLTPRRPLYLYYFITRFFIYSPLFIFLTFFFSYTLLFF